MIMEHIFLVFMVDIEEKTVLDFEKEMNIMKIEYGWNYKSIEEFKDFLKDIQKSIDYKITKEVVGYFTDENLANQMLLDNVFDVNDGGSYPYAAIIKLPTNTFYPECFSIASNPKIYKFVKNIETNEMGYVCVTKENGELRDDLLFIADELYINAIIEYFQ